MKKIFCCLMLICISFCVKAQSENGDVFEFVEQMPEFPGGEDSLIRFIIANYTYPEPAIKAEIEGKVVVKFVVNEQGEVEDITIQRAEFKTIKKNENLNLDAQKEQMKQAAMNVVRKMPRWKPGMQKGVAVSVMYSLPITYELTD